MNTTKSWLFPLANEIIDELCKKKLIELKAPREKVVELAYGLIYDEVTIEERLNKEVKELLKKYDLEIERGHLDYRKLFELTKQKLIKERNIIL